MLTYVIAKFLEMKATNSVALAALVTPVWLPWLEQANVYLALATPVLAAIWLVTQISMAWYKWLFNKDGK